MANTLYGLPVDQINGKVTQCPGGVYITQRGYSYFVPEDVSDATTAFIYYPGSGGAGNDAAVLRKIISEGTPNQIIIISDTAYEDINKASERYFNIIDNIGSENGANITHISTMGFSAGGPNTFNGIINNLAAHPDAGPQSAVFVDVVGFNASDEAISLLKDNESTLMFLEPMNTVTDFEKRLATNGVDVILAWAGNGHDAHVTLNKEAFQNGIVDLTSADIEELANNGIYTFVKYNTTTGKWDQISMEEVAEKFANGTTAINDPFRYYKKLGNLGDLQCNNEFIASKVNSIRSAIKNTNFLTTSGVDSYGSTTNIPNAEADIIQTYFTSCATLLNYIEKDTVKIVQIGNSIKDLDDSLSKEASNLNNSVNYYNTSSGNTNYYTNSSSSYGGTVTGATVSGLSSGLVSSLVEDEKKQEKIKTIKKEFLKYDELYSDKEKYVYEKENEYKVVIHYENDEVLTLEYYFDYKTKEAAKEAITELKKKFEGVEDVVAEGQYVKVIFDKDVYKGLTLDELKKMYEDLKELKKEMEEI